MIKKLWNDTVFSKVIALCIFGLISYICVKAMPIVNVRFNSILSNLSKINLEISITNLFLSSIVAILLTIMFFIIKERVAEDKMKKISATPVELEKLDKEFCHLKRVGILGISNVGKTTLIENLCDLPNQNSETRETRGYIINTSNRENNYIILIDGRGQSISIQNDIAIKSNILIILLDHNFSDTETKLQNQRLNRHKDFLKILKDRLLTSKHIPQKVIFLLNKEDLWSKSKRGKNKLSAFLRQNFDEFKSGFNETEFAKFYFSNDDINKRKRIIKELNNI